jgi:uncharacterized Zn-finger protein
MKIILLTLQFFYLHDILCMHSSICLKLCEKRSSLKRNTHLHTFSRSFCVFICSSSTSDMRLLNKKKITCRNILLNAFLFCSFCFGNRYSSSRFLGWRTNLESTVDRLWLGLRGRCLNHERMLVKNDEQLCA